MPLERSPESDNRGKRTGGASRVLQSPSGIPVIELPVPELSAALRARHIPLEEPASSPERVETLGSPVERPVGPSR